MILRVQRDLRSREAGRVAAPIEVFVMVAHCLDRERVETQALEYASSLL